MLFFSFPISTTILIFNFLQKKSERNIEFTGSFIHIVQYLLISHNSYLFKDMFQIRSASLVLIMMYFFFLFFNNNDFFLLFTKVSSKLIKVFKNSILNTCSFYLCICFFSPIGIGECNG